MTDNYIKRSEYEKDQVIIKKDIDELKDSRFSMTINMALMEEKLTNIIEISSETRSDVKELTNIRHDDHYVKPLGKFERVSEKIIFTAIGIIVGQIVMYLIGG